MAEQDDQKDVKSVSALEQAMASGAEVDLNRVRVRTLVLCKSKSKMESAVNYLIRRGWETYVTDTLIDAFKQVDVFKPDFILLSVNFNTQKIHQIPKLFAQAFNLPLVTFGEYMDTKTLKLLQEVDSNYKMQGTPSGPGIHRRIKNILHEMYQSPSAPDKGAIDRMASQEDTAIEGGPIRRKKEVYTFSVDEDEAANRNKRRSNFYENYTASEPEDSSNNSHMVPGTRTNEILGLSELEALAHQQDPSWEANLNKENQFGRVEALQNQKGPQGQSEFSRTPMPEGVERNDVVVLNPLAQPQSQVNGSQKDQSDGATAGEFEKINAEEATSRTNATGNQKSNPTVVPTNSNKTPGFLLPNQNGSDKSFSGFSIDLKNPEFEHFVIRVAKATAADPTEPVQKLLLSSECFVLPFRIGGRTTYLVVAHSGDRTAAVQFNLRLRDLLQFEMAQVDPFSRVDELVETKLESVDLSLRSEGEIFTSKIRSGRQEVLVKLVEESVKIPVIQKNKDGEKLKIDARDLIAELSTGADVFIHMPKNEKYFLYLKKASAISTKQQANLVSAKSALYINETDETSYKEKFLRNQTIQSIRDLRAAIKKAS